MLDKTAFLLNRNIYYRDDYKKWEELHLHIFSKKMKIFPCN